MSHLASNLVSVRANFSVSANTVDIAGIPSLTALGTCQEKFISYQADTEPAGFSRY